MTATENKVIPAFTALIAFVAVGFICTTVTAQQTLAPFTADQVALGRTAYAANCKSCHQADLSEADEAPALAGEDFMMKWSDRTTQQLYDTIDKTMPYGAGGSLEPDTYASLVAYILYANGAQAGDQALTPTTSVRVGMIATGTRPPDLIP